MTFCTNDTRHITKTNQDATRWIRENPGHPRERSTNRAWRGVITSASGCLALATLLGATEAKAFKMEGHRTIEATAYRRMLTTELGSVGGIAGKKILAALIKDNVLVKPPCFGDPDPLCSKDSLKSWPQLRSDRPDMVIARQFSGAGQCFHFMAKESDEEGNGEGLKGAYFRCVRVLRTLAAEVILMDNVNGEMARANNRSIYELMHAVADSYSKAHTSKGANGRIEYLKVWDPATWYYPSRWFATNPHPTTRHRAGDKRDEDFLEREHNNQLCTELSEHPYEVPWDCLSADAKSAVQATEKLLSVIYQLRFRHRAKGTTKIDEVEGDMKEWDDFMTEYLPGPQTSHNWNKASEYSPAKFGGLKISYFSGTNSTAFSYGSFLNSRGATPLTPAFHLDVGGSNVVLDSDEDAPAKHKTSLHHLFIESSMSYQVPLGSHLTVGLTPFYARLYLEKALFKPETRTDSRSFLDVGMRLLKFNFFLPTVQRGARVGPWASLEGPVEWSPLHGRASYGMSAVVGLWLDQPRVEMVNPQPAPDCCAETTKEERLWNLPMNKKLRSDAVDWSTILSAELTSFKDSTHRGNKSPFIFGGSAGLRRDSRWDDSMPRWIFGVMLSVLARNQLLVTPPGVVYQQRFLTVAFSPEVRLWLMDLLEIAKLGISLAPRAEMGYVTSIFDDKGMATDSSPNGKHIFFQTGLRYGAFILFESFEIDVNGPQRLIFSEKLRPFSASGESLTFRASFRFSSFLWMRQRQK
jgi:hypothetical protein